MVIDAWSRYSVELLSRLVCQLTISFHTFLHDQPAPPAEIRDSNMVLQLSNNIFAYFALSLSAFQVHMIQERCWFSQIDFFIEYFPHRIKILFLSSQFFMSSTYTDKNNPLSRCTKRHSQFGNFSQPCFNRIFSYCLSHNSPAKDDRTDSAQEEQLGFPYWTMI